MMLPLVVYLSRWKDRQWAEPFFRSIMANAPGAPYELLVVLKGYPEGEAVPGIDAIRAVIVTVSEARISDDGYDLTAYMNMAKRHSNERMLFLNSYSRILAPHWLASFLGAFVSVPKCGVAAATGSYEVVPGTSFPNINVRTNAFMISRDLFMSVDSGALATRTDCTRFEAGQKSLTRQVMDRGYEPVLVDRWGKAWGAPEWPASNVFRAGLQEGLLVADNRTHHYAAGTTAKRRKLARLAWGDASRVSRLPLMRRLMNELTWRLPRLGIYGVSA